jgi:hypothetical protein
MNERRITALLCFLFLVVALVPYASAQQPNDPSTASFRAAIALEQKTAPTVRSFFSGALQNFLTIGHAMLDQPSGGPDSGLKQNAQTRLNSRRLTSLRSGHAPNSHDFDGDSRTVQISDPSRDFLFSQIGGFTHNNSSSAWCGHNVVTAFMNSTGVVDTNLVPLFLNNNFEASSSFVGISVSHNDGKSFVDQGYAPPGDFPNVIFGNPVVACSSANRFYLATSFAPGIILSEDPSFAAFSPLSSVSLNISDDGGKNWTNPISAIVKDGSFHFIDKGWVAIDPSNPNRLYVSYTDFDLEGFNGDLFPAARCPGVFRTGIELVSSADGGQTWSAPSILREDCQPEFASSNLATGSQVAVGRDGSVYVCYDVFPIGPFADSTPIRLAFRRSSDGQSFDPESTVDTIVAAANIDATFDNLNLVFNGFLQGFFRNLPSPSLAIDTSKHNRHDTIYLAWSDGRDNSQQVELLTKDRKYHFGDILLASSSDGGLTWSKSTPISPAPPGSSGRDQFQPTIGVDSHGNMAVCYYDRRNDPANNAVDRYCSLSQDHGKSFRDVRQTESSWIPVRTADIFIGANSLGDYDSMAAHKGTGGDDDSGSFFDSFQVIKNEVTVVRGRRTGRDQ